MPFANKQDAVQAARSWDNAHPDRARERKRKWWRLNKSRYARSKYGLGTGR